MIERPEWSTYLGAWVRYANKLEAERDALRAEAMEWRDKVEGCRIQTLADGQRLDAALAERDEARAHWREENSSHAETLLDLKATQDKLAALRDAALAEAARLREALEAIAGPSGPIKLAPIGGQEAQRIARAALAPAAETPDD